MELLNKTFNKHVICYSILKLEPLILSYLNTYGETCKGILIHLIHKITGVSISSVNKRIEKLISKNKIYQYGVWISSIKREKSDVIETLESGIKVTQERNILSINSNMSENYNKIKNQSMLLLPKLKDKLVKSIRLIEQKIMKKYDPLDVLAFLVVKNLFGVPHLYSESSFRGVQLIPETVQNIVLRNEYYCYPNKYRDSFDEIEETCSEYIRLLSDYVISYTLHHTEINTIEKEILINSILTFLFVRGDAFPIHYEQIALELFTQINNVLLPKGFSIEQYFETVKEIERQINFNMNEPKKKLYNEWKLYNEKLSELEGKVSDDEFFKISNSPLEKSKARLIPYRKKLSELMLKGAFEIEIGDNINQNLMDYLCLNFGENSDWNSPFDKTKTVLKPIIRSNKKYYCFLPQHLIRNVIPIIESILTEQDKELCNYSQVKGSFLENKVFTLMKKLFDPNNQKNCVFSNLKYPKKKNELDVLVIKDDSLLLIEIKNKKKRTIAGKNVHEILEVLKSDFQAHINEAFEQTNKALNYIQSKETVTFETKQGSLIIEKKDYHNFYQLIICLENFSPLTTNLKLIQAWDSNFIKSNTFPWISTIYDLMILCDWLETSDRFLDYLNHRIENYKTLEIYSVDEIDYLGYYLAFGDLKSHVREKKGDLHIIVGFAEAIERYYDYMCGKIILPSKNLKKR